VGGIHFDISTLFVAVRIIGSSMNNSRISMFGTRINGSSMDDSHVCMLALFSQDLMELLAKNPMLFFWVYDSCGDGVG
jgi:hypothetical protein